MTRKQQSKFVRDLSLNIAKDIISKLPAIPETESWDGHELRMLLAERHSDSAGMSCIKDEPRSRRAFAFRNVLTTSNL